MDTTGWLTKDEARAATGVRSTKSLERWAKAGLLQQATRPQAHGPDVVVYHPEDVRRLAAERQPAAAPFVLPAGSNGGPPVLRETAPPETLSISTGRERGVDGLQQLAAAVERLMSQTSQTLPPFSTLREAAAWSRLSKACLKRLVEAGTLPATRDGRRLMFASGDLEALRRGRSHGRPDE
jgi:hypothetical protein